MTAEEWQGELGSGSVALAGPGIVHVELRGA